MCSEPRRGRQRRLGERCCFFVALVCQRLEKSQLKKEHRLWDRGDRPGAALQPPSLSFPIVKRRGIMLSVPLSLWAQNGSPGAAGAGEEGAGGRTLVAVPRAGRAWWQFRCEPAARRPSAPAPSASLRLRFLFREAGEPRGCASRGRPECRAARGTEWPRLGRSP